jgi:hypothetical protein
MVETVSMRILKKDNNRRGDLFGRLIGYLFLSLGYDDVHLNQFLFVFLKTPFFSRLGTALQMRHRSHLAHSSR